MIICSWIACYKLYTTKYHLRQLRFLCSPCLRRFHGWRRYWFRWSCHHSPTGNRRAGGYRRCPDGRKAIPWSDWSTMMTGSATIFTRKTPAMMTSMWTACKYRGLPGMSSRLCDGRWSYGKKGISQSGHSCSCGEYHAQDRFSSLYGAWPVGD